MVDETNSSLGNSAQDGVSAPKYTAAAPFALSNFLRGGVAGCTAKVMIYPFDRLKMIYQVRGSEVGRFGFRSFARRIQQVVQQEGATSLWKGNLTALGKTFPHSAIVFFSFDAYYNSLANSFPESLPLARLLAGGFAGLTATAITYPIDVWNTRMAVSYGHFNYREIIMIPKENFRLSLSRGFLPTAIGIFPYAGVSFLCFETLKSIIVLNKRHRQQHHRMEGQRSALECDGPVASVGEQDSSNTGQLNRWKQSGSTEHVHAATRHTPVDRVSGRTTVEEKFCKAQFGNQNQFSGLASAATSSRNFIARNTEAKIHSPICNNRDQVTYASTAYQSGSYETAGRVAEASELEYALSSPLCGGSSSGTQSSRDDLTVLESMVCGGIAGVVSQSVTYPLDTVRKVLQANYFLRHFQQGGYCSRYENPTMGQVVREIFQASGLRGFYNGLSLNWIKGFAAAAIAFTLNDKLKSF